MSCRLILIPINAGVGLTTVSLGLIRAFEQSAIKVNFFKPISQPESGTMDRSTIIVKNTTQLTPPEPFSLSYAEEQFSAGNTEDFLEQILERLETNIDGNETLIIEGLNPTKEQPYANKINRKLTEALGANVIFVISQDNQPTKYLQEQIEIASENYGGVRSNKVIGCIINKVNAPTDKHGKVLTEFTSQLCDKHYEPAMCHFQNMKIFSSNFQLFGCIPWNSELITPRVIDLQTYLQANILNLGDMNYRRIRSITICANSTRYILPHIKAGALLIIPIDRTDVLIAASLAAMNGIKLGAVLLTGEGKLDSNITELCKHAFATGLPILQTENDSWQSSLLLQKFNVEVPDDDTQRIERVQEHVAQHLNKQYLFKLVDSKNISRVMAPATFKYYLMTQARKSKQTILLPEGEEPRTIKAAAICGKKGIAKCILLGDPEKVIVVAKQQGVALNNNIVIENPSKIRMKYVESLVSMRKHKGMTPDKAELELKDNVVLGTMMLANNDADGLVSGAVHTTANTIRPALQLIKTHVDSALVSSLFFMLLPEQVLVYADCAINPDPTAEQLAEIAIQSALSAKSFGIDPKVAMISYSTGNSGTGDDVEKVQLATELAKQKRPDLLIDGPLQYDAAVIKNVAAQKAPDSPVAGLANVLIFPDLNTGNTTYKAVQRSANVVSIGPMLQGLKKPVNDLSRGALVDDIVYTIALTAIQAISSNLTNQDN